MTLRTVGIVALVLFLLHGHFAALYPALTPLQVPLAGIAALCAVAVGWRQFPRSVFLTTAVAGIAAAFVLYAPVPTYMTTYSDAKRTLLLLTFGFTLIVAPILVNDRPALRTFLATLSGAALVIVALTLPSLPRLLTEGGRLSIGEDGNPIWLARAAGLAALGVWVAVQTGHLRRTWLWALAPTLLVIVLTGSRGPLASLLIVAALLTPLLLRRVTALGTAGVLLAAGAGLALLTNPTLFDAALARFARPDTLGATSGRDVLWGTAWSYITDHPQGLGAGALAALLPLAKYPHNIVLEALAEFGWVAGGLLILALLGGVWHLVRAARTREAGPVLLLGIALFALLNALVSGDLTSPKELYIALALGLMLPSRVTRPLQRLLIMAIQPRGSTRSPNPEP